MTIIYEPKGKAREYAPLAANLYKSCSHGCKFCFAPSAMRMDRDTFHAENRLKKNALDDLVKDARKLRGDNREILLSFMGDVYNPDELPGQGITRQAIKTLIENDLHFTVLTKGGARVRRDLDLFGSYPRCSIGQTIVFSDQATADYWEPNAAPLIERYELAHDAHAAGIKTWISLEPVIDPDQALDVIGRLHGVVDLWKVGPVNYQKTDVDWHKFHDDVVALLEQVGATYILKKALLEKAGIE
jgi:DNA repair photolyase